MAQTNTSKLGDAALFVCTFATWRQNLQILGGVAYRHDPFRSSGHLLLNRMTIEKYGKEY